MALSTVTLAGLMVIQAVGPAAINNHPVIDSAVERSAEVISGEDFLALEELSNTDISSGTSVLPK